MTNINIRLYPPRIHLRHQNHSYPRHLPRQIDAQLYAKYGLTKSEQKFIESMIKADGVKKEQDNNVHSRQIFQILFNATNG